MVNRELVFPRMGIETQVDFNAWIDNLKQGAITKKQLLNEITHTFAEFACNVPIVDWYYDLPKQKDDLLRSFQQGVRAGSLRSRSEFYEGFVPLINKIEAATKPSFGIWISDPGPKNEGYGDYGYIYLYDIPIDKSKVHAFALRINNFDKETVKRCLILLSEFGLPAGNLVASPQVFEAKKEISLVRENDGMIINHKLETIEDLFFLIHCYLRQKFKPKDIAKGLTGQFLKDTYQKYKIQIHRLFTSIWSTANNIDKSFDFQAHIFSYMMHRLFPNVSGGSCPSAGMVTSSLSSYTPLKLVSAEDKEGTKVLHRCPCGISFLAPKGPAICPLCKLKVQDKQQ